MSRSSHRFRKLDAFLPEAGAVPYPGYKLIRLRGRGGFATVWEASSPDGSLVALKFMSSQNTSTTAKELRSLQAVQAISHPHLLRFHRVWSLPGNIVISMDLADASLLDLLELYLQELHRPIEVEKLGRYMYHVAEALDFLNGRHHRIDGRIVGLQHADIKPNNILLIQDTPYLADYGLATATFGPVTPCSRQGTAEFCAPEVFTGYLTETSDQYSLAVTYFVLRTGRFPFPPPPDHTRLKDYRRPEPDLSALVDEAERAVVSRALAPIPQQRFPCSGEFVGTLLAALKLQLHRNDHGQVTVEPLPKSSSSTPTRISGTTRRSLGPNSSWKSDSQSS